jgi:protein SCO1
MRHHDRMPAPAHSRQTGCKAPGQESDRLCCRQTFSGRAGAAAIIGAIAAGLIMDIASGAASSTTIGGPFTLIAPSGTTVTDQTYRGRWLLIYFGYTSCPNTCPTALLEIATALDKLGSEAARLQPIFITVDPEHDTPAVMGEYTQAFDARIVGLTGSPQQIAAVASAYGAYYTRHSIGPGGDDVVDHSTYIYLMNPQGTFERGFDADAPGDLIAEAVHKRMMRHAGTANPSAMDDAANR